MTNGVKNILKPRAKGKTVTRAKDVKNGDTLMMEMCSKHDVEITKT